MGKWIKITLEKLAHYKHLFTSQIFAAGFFKPKGDEV